MSLCIKTKTSHHVRVARENHQEHYGAFPLGVFSVHPSMCLRIQIGSVCKVYFLFLYLFSVLHYIVSLSPIVKSSIAWNSHNLFYYYIPFGYLGCFKYFTCINNAEYLFVNEYLIVFYIFYQVEA